MRVWLPSSQLLRHQTPMPWVPPEGVRGVDERTPWGRQEDPMPVARGGAAGIWHLAEYVVGERLPVRPDCGWQRGTKFAFGWCPLPPVGHRRPVTDPQTTTSTFPCRRGVHRLNSMEFPPAEGNDRREPITHAIVILLELPPRLPVMLRQEIPRPCNRLEDVLRLCSRRVLLRQDLPRFWLS
jgi:hypothetical protein